MQTKTPFFARTPVLALCALLSCLLWGSAIPIIKLGYSLFSIDTTNPGSVILFAGARFTLAGLLVLIFVFFRDRKSFFVPRCHWGKVMWVAAFQTFIQYVLYYIGLTHTSGVTASIVIGSTTFFSLLVSALIFRCESLTPKKGIGCIIGLAGVVLAQLKDGATFSFSMQGEGLVLLSCICAAVAAVLISRYSQHLSPLSLSGWQFLIGGVALMAVGIALGGHWSLSTPTGFGVLLYLACVSGVGYSLWGCLLKYNSVSRVTVFGFTTPMFGVLISAFLLKESIFSLRGLVALALVCIGIIVVNRSAGKDA